MRHILILEDEELAAQKIKTHLKEHYQDEVKLDWIQSVAEGITFLKNNTPDLILSDIELLDGRAFIIYEHVEIKSPIIFTTAYDQYLLDAFKTTGIAYLLKPFDKEELEKALRKYESLFKEKSSYNLEPSIVAQLKSALVKSEKTYKQRFTIKKSTGIILLKTEDISHFSADDNIVFAHDKKAKKHIVNHKMAELEELLDPKSFFRINRSEIVHIHSIEKIEPYFNNRLAIYVSGLQKPMITAGSRTAEFKRWIEG